jgi:hypothetical protein
MLIYYVNSVSGKRGKAQWHVFSYVVPATMLISVHNIVNSSLFVLTAVFPWVLRYVLNYQRGLRLSNTAALLDEVQWSILKLRDFTASPSVKNGQVVRRLEKASYAKVPWTVL